MKKMYQTIFCTHCNKAYSPTQPRQLFCMDEACQLARRSRRIERDRNSHIRAIERIGRESHNRQQREYYSLHRDKRKEERYLLARNNPKKRLISNAKTRSNIHGVPFSLSEKDVDVPELCPVLGIPLAHGDGRQEDGSPSLDRIIPKLGYVPGNVIVVSAIANRIKNSATVEQIQAVADFYKGRTTLCYAAG